MTAMGIMPGISDMIGGVTDRAGYARLATLFDRGGATAPINEKQRMTVVATLLRNAAGGGTQQGAK